MCVQCAYSALTLKLKKLLIHAPSMYEEPLLHPPHTPCVHVGAAGFVYTIIICQVHHYQISETMLRAIDIITTAVPPALPAALTVGAVYALNRLRKHKIFCISPQR